VGARPGAVNLLHAMTQEGVSVVTSSTRALAEVRWRAAGLPVPKHLVTASDLRRGEPFPDPYLKGAEMLGMVPVECVVAEDAASGVRSGKAAGARVLALRTTSMDEDLLSAGADWIVDDLSALSLDLQGLTTGLAFHLKEKK